VLNDNEQRVWDDIQRFWAANGAEPSRPAPFLHRRVPRDLADLPALVVAGIWVAILLAILGALPAGLAVGVATAVGWVLWRHWPRLGEMGAATTWSVLGEVSGVFRRHADWCSSRGRQVGVQTE
jgi:hypothetical protein